MKWDLQNYNIDRLTTLVQDLANQNTMNTLKKPKHLIKHSMMVKSEDL